MKIKIGRNQYVNLEQVTYCKADNGYTELYLACGKKTIVSTSLTKFYSETLMQQSFTKKNKKMLRVPYLHNTQNTFLGATGEIPIIRVSQSYLVNPDFICGISKKEKKIYLRNGETLFFTLSIKNLVYMLLSVTDYKLVSNQAIEGRVSFYNKLLIVTKEKIYFVDQDQIVYCKSQNNSTSIFIQNGNIITFRKTIKNTLKFLDPKVFIRVNQSYIININQINKVNAIKKLIRMKNGSSIPYTLKEPVHAIK